MNVLDVDLDFFLDQRVTRPLGPGRPSPDDITPWTASAVEKFLVDQCGLDPQNPLPGYIVTEHHEVFDVWRRLIAGRHLTVPFDLVHVDAHADMGMGDASPSYIMAELLHNDVAQRTSPKRGDNGLLASNYVAFAMACRWISSFTYVHHPNLRKENIGDHDIPDCFFKEYDLNCDHLQLKALPPESIDGIQRSQEFSPVHLEPEIPVRLVPCEEFTWKGSFSFLFAAHSPRYTPPTADRLLPILRRFVLKPTYYCGDCSTCGEDGHVV